MAGRANLGGIDEEESSGGGGCRIRRGGVEGRSGRESQVGGW